MSKKGFIESSTQASGEMKEWRPKHFPQTKVRTRGGVSVRNGVARDSNVILLTSSSKIKVGRLYWLDHLA
jgi:hypothetical protein